MGKAGKWIRNFLLGKKEEKLKQVDTFYTENNKSAKVSSNNKMVVKRKWSLRKLSSSGRITGKVVTPKFSRSFEFDSGECDHSTKMQIQALLEAQISRYLPKALAMVYEDVEFERIAAIKIQSAFRSYLARKALHALRGLVKIQALVRGHLVRKQTSATLRSMHALMAIQVRARINRIQMVEETNLLAKQHGEEIHGPNHREEIPHFKGLMTEENKDSRDMHLKEMLGALKSKSGPLDWAYVKSRKSDSMAFYSKRLSVSKRENRVKENNTTTTTTTTAPNSPANYRDMFESNPTTVALSTSQRDLVPHRQSWSPNYMNKTRSSRAKSRSRSEPKQRPIQGMKHKSNSAESSLNGPRKNMVSNSLRFEHGSLDHWATNLLGSMKDSKRDSIGGSSTVTSDSYY